MKKIVLFPGSFNPFHIGHLNVLQKAESIFGRGNVIICVGINPDKFSGYELSEEQLKEIEKRISYLRTWTGRQVDFYYGFLHEHIIKYEKEGYGVTILRGLRNGDDLNYEMNQLAFIQDFKKDVKTVFIACDKDVSHISSSAIRKLKDFGGEESIKNYIV